MCGNGNDLAGRLSEPRFAYPGGRWDWQEDHKWLAPPI